MTASKSAAQELREILEGDTRQQFDGTGCSDHLRRRNLRVSVAVVGVLLVMLIALLLL